MISFLTVISSLIIGTAIVLIIFPQGCQKGNGWILPISLGCGLGQGVTSLMAFIWMVIAGQLNHNYFILESCFALIAGILALYRLRSTTDIKLNTINDASNIDVQPVLRNSFVLLLLLTLLWFVLRSLYQYPHGKWDAWAIWNLRPRVMFRFGAQWLNAFSESGGWSHLDYPLLLPLTIYRSWVMLGYETVVIPCIVAGLYLFSTIFLIYKVVSILRNTNQGYLAALTMLATIWFLKHSTSQFADVPFAYFICSAIVLFVLKEHYTQNSRGLILLAGLFTGCALWTKNEGWLLFIVTMLYFILPFIMMTKRDHLKVAIAFGTGVFPFLCITLFFKIKFAPQNDVINTNTLYDMWQSISNISSYLEIGKAFLKEIVTFSYGILFFLGAYFWLSKADNGFNSELNIKPPLMMLLLMLSGYFFVYVITPHDLQWHIDSSLNRLLLQLWPSTVFIFFLNILYPEQKGKIENE